MSKPYVYLDRYKRDGFAPAIVRNIPTDPGSHVRAAFHGIGDGSRSLEVYVQPNGWWSVETGPGPAHGGARQVIARGRLPIDDEPEQVTHVYPRSDDHADYQAGELRRVLDNGPAPDESWFRLKAEGESESRWLNISPAQLAAIIDVIGGA